MSERLYDVWINGKGYRLVEGPNGFSSNIGTPLATKVVQGDYAYDSFDLYSVTAQSSFIGGIGQLNMEDLSKYLWGYRIDSRGERVTLGPKMDSLQPDSDMDQTGSTGVIDVQSQLNQAIANDPNNQVRTWLELNTTTDAVAIPFATQGGTPGGATFSPDDIASLQLWLKADAGVYTDIAGTTPATDTDAVELWEDQSSQGNDFSNENGTCTWNDAEVNSLPAIIGSGDSEGFLKGLAPILGNTAKTIFLIVKPATTNADEAILDFGYQNGPWSGEDYYYSESNDIVVEDGKREFTAALSTGDYQIVCIRQSGENIQDTDLWIDDVQSAVTATGNRELNIGNNDLTATLFCRNAASLNKFSQCAIVEVIAYNTALSDANKSQVTSYLNDRMSGSITPPSSNVVIERVWAYMRYHNTLTSDSTLYFEIYTDSAGEPDTLVTNAQAEIAISDIEYYGQWIQASFATVPTLSAETSYWLVVGADNLAAGESVEVLTAETGVTSSLNMQTREGSTWTATDGYTALLMTQYVNQHPDVPAAKFIEWNGFIYVLAGKRLYRILSTTSMEAVEDASNIYEFDADATDMMLVQKPGDTDPYLLIALGNATPLELWDGDETWATAGATETADKICLHDNLWWRTSKSATDGVFVQGTSDYEDFVASGTAGAKAQVGDSQFIGAQLFSWKGQLYVGKADGLYIVTYADTYPAAGATIQTNRILSLESEINPYNFAAMAIWQEDLYFSLASGVAKFSSGNVFSSVTPDSSLLDQERHRGAFVSFIPTLIYLYAAYESDIGDWSQIMAYDGAWHSLATLDRSGDLGGALFVDSGLHSELPRIWTTSHNVITSFVQPTWTTRRWTFAEDSSDSLVKYTHRDASSWYDDTYGQLYTSWINAELINIIKDWVALEVVAENIDSTNHYITVYYRFDETDAWTLLDTVDEEPVTKMTFPSNTYATKIQLRFDFSTTEAYNSAQMLGFALRYVSRPDTTEIFGCQIIISDNLELRNGGHEPRTGAELWADLKVARDAKEAVVLKTLDGSEIDVHVSSLARNVKERKEINASTMNDAYIAVVEMIEA